MPKLSIHISKDTFKFAAAHMTVFADGEKEALHGHNYQVTLTAGLLDSTLKNMVSFHGLKEALKEVCEEWDEKVLMAALCPFLRIKSRSAREVDFELCGKHYVLPADETVWLKLENITVETLSEEFCARYIKRLDPSLLKRVKSIEVRIDESDGQGATAEWIAGDARGKSPAKVKSKKR